MTTTVSRLSGPIHDDDDLLTLWRALLPTRVAGRTLWMLLLDAGGSPVPQLTQIDDLPERVDLRSCASLAELCSTLIQDLVRGGSVALALGRPGWDRPTQADRDWAIALSAAARERGLRLHPLHLTTRDGVRPLRPDDLLDGRDDIPA